MVWASNLGNILPLCEYQCTDTINTALCKNLLGAFTEVVLLQLEEILRGLLLNWLTFGSDILVIADH